MDSMTYKYLTDKMNIFLGLQLVWLPVFFHNHLTPYRIKHENIPQK